MIKKQYVKSRKVSKATFIIPKSELPDDIEVKDIFLVGDFNEWDPSRHPMKRNSKGEYRVTIDLRPGREYKFRYMINGKHWYNDWNADAYLPNEFGMDNCVLITPPVTD